MRMRSLQVALMALAVPAVLAAQGNGQGRMGGGMGRMGSMSPYAMEVPPAADVLTKAVGLNADQAAQYTKLRDAHVAATKVLRDSLTAQRAKAREAMQAGNRDHGMEMMRASRAQGQALQDAAKSFDDSVAALLTPDQKPKYESWKKSETQRLVQERRQQFGGRSGGGSGGSR